MSDLDEVKKSRHILISVDHLNGYNAILQEEVAATIALLDITSEQINKCKDANEIEALFDAAMEYSPIKNGEEHVARRLCRCITLVGMLTQTEIPVRYHLIDNITCKAAGLLLADQQKLKAEAEANKPVLNLNDETTA